MPGAFLHFPITPEFCIILRQRGSGTFQRFSRHIGLRHRAGPDCLLLLNPGTDVPPDTCRQFCRQNRNQRIQRNVGDRIKIIRQAINGIGNGLNTTAQRAVSALSYLNNQTFKSRSQAEKIAVQVIYPDFGLLMRGLRTGQGGGQRLHLLAVLHQDGCCAEVFHPEQLYGLFC